jgi:hypothetical protein
MCPSRLGPVTRRFRLRQSVQTASRTTPIATLSEGVQARHAGSPRTPVSVGADLGGQDAGAPRETFGETPAAIEGPPDIARGSFFPSVKLAATSPSC